MSHTLSRSFLTIVLVVTIFPSVAAKGRTVKLTLTGPALKNAIEITDPAAMANVWTGNSSSGCGVARSFFRTKVAEPPQNLPRYRLAFHVSPHPEEAVRVMYAVGYVFDPATSKAFVYFPKAGEEDYDLNAAAISRKRQAGNWYEADRGFSDAMAPHMTRARPN
jgi:hypothetical protein